MGRPRTNIRPRIVRAARARFLAEGVDGASLRTIARDARTNIGMVFYYFPTKDELFLAVVEEVYAKLLVDLETALTLPESTRDRLLRAVLRFGALSDEELQVVRLVAREALVSSVRFRRVLERAERGHLSMLLSTLAQGVEKGELDPEIPLPILLLATLGLGGLPQFIRRGVRDQTMGLPLPEAGELAETCMGLLFRAIGAREAPKRRRRQR